MGSDQAWNAELYDHNFGFVSDLGKGVVQLLQPSHGERILDIGCGSGDLSHELFQLGATVTGMDLSREMIDHARRKYPEIDFFVGDAEHIKVDRKFDAVFSNAALHWVKDHIKVLDSIWNVLNPGGRFVAEFGGKGNVGIVLQAIYDVLQEDYNVDGDALNPWYFSSIADYSLLLEQQGFHVTYATHFDRPTKLNDGEKGIFQWLSGFADVFFTGFSETQKKAAYDKVSEKLEMHLFRDGHWFLDYKRLRMIAIKP